VVGFVLVAEVEWLVGHRAHTSPQRRFLVVLVAWWARSSPCVKIGDQGVRVLGAANL
jgi:hypothetical protein